MKIHSIFFLTNCFLTLSSLEYVKGQTASCLNFDGVNDRIEIAHDPAFNISNAITIEAWINTNYNSEQYICTKNEDSWYIAQDGSQASSGKFSAFFNGLSPQGWLAGNTTINDSIWHHVAVTYDGSSLKLYVDGRLDAQAAKTGAIATGTNNVTIGNRPFFSFDRFFRGNIDELRIWNIARTTCELRQYMNCEITGTMSGLVSNYHFNQGSTAGNNGTITSLTDDTGSNTGTLTNFALTGNFSNWLSPGGVVSGSTTPALIPVLNASASPSQICAGESATLSVVGSTGYTWSNGLTGSTVFVSPNSSTNYTVSDGCAQSSVNLNVNLCTNLGKLSLPETLIFPNPTQNILFINNGAGETSFELYSMLNNKVMETKQSGEQKQLIMGDLPSGIYFLKIKQGTSEITVRVIKY